MLQFKQKNTRNNTGFRHHTNHTYHFGINPKRMLVALQLREEEVVRVVLEFPTTAVVRCLEGPLHSNKSTFPKISLGTMFRMATPNSNPPSCHSQSIPSPENNSVSSSIMCQLHHESNHNSPFPQSHLNPLVIRVMV